MCYLTECDFSNMYEHNCHKGACCFFLQFTCLTDGQTSLTESFLTEEVDPRDLTFYIWTVSACNRSNKSTPATINIHPHKPRGEKQRAEKRKDLCVLRHYVM